MAKLQKCNWHSVFGCRVCFYPATGGAAAMDGNYSIVSGNLSTTAKTDATFAQLLKALERDERPKPVAKDSISADERALLNEAILSVRKPARRAPAAQDSTLRDIYGQPVSDPLAANEPRQLVTAPLKHKKYVYKQDE
jgi:hypothetical protein